MSKLRHEIVPPRHSPRGAPSAALAAATSVAPSVENAGDRPVGCTSLKVRQLSRRVSQHFDRVIGAAGLKTTQFSLLSMLVRVGPMRPGELAERLQMDASTLTRNLQPLVALGWVRLGPGDDRRSRLVAATASGEAKQREASHHWRQAQASFNDKVGTLKVARLHALLDECLTAMDEPAGGDDVG